MSDYATVKEEGNKCFSESKYGEAAACYTKALSLSNVTGNDKAVLLKNRAACFLKLDKNNEAIADCTAALDICPIDTKALYRRCLALEQTERHEDAYRDARKLVQLEPKNTAIQPVLRRLHATIQDKIDQQQSTDNRVSQMFDLTFQNTSGDEEKRKQAANNLIVLAREPAGAEKIFANNGVASLLRLLDTERDKELQLTSLRVLACLSTEHHDRAVSILEQMTLKKLCSMIAYDHEELSTSAAHLMRKIIESVTDINNLKGEREKYEAKRKADPASKMRPFPFIWEQIDSDAIDLVDTMLPPIIQMLGSCKVSVYGRDNMMELLIKFVTRRDGVGWSKKLLEAQGVQQLLTVAGTIPEHKTIPVSQNSRMHVSLCLSKIHEDLVSDQERNLFLQVTNSYFDDLLRDDIMESKLEAVMALAALLQGPSGVGNSILAREGMLDMIIAMADSGSAIHVKCAVEALVYSASKKEKCAGVIQQATPILKQLYQSQNDSIKVRALVGLCKLGSYGGSDASVKTFADGSNQTLAKACRRFLCNPAKDVDLRKWAAEGLAYLTLDADVKEDLVEDTDSLRSIVDLSKIRDKATLYPVAQIFVNLANCYEKKEIEPELLELAKFSKQHVPEEHEKDKEPYISQRVEKLVKTGVVNALVAFGKSDSENSNELLSRVYLAVATNADNRGLMVQQGCVKQLILLANEGTDAGRIAAAHAIAKIAITQNPEIAFPGQRACEVVRPLIQLLGIDKTAIQNFEALMALTNLAQMSDTVRMRIIKEKGISQIEHYCFEEHEEIRRAAVECLCNMVVNEEVQKMFHGENDRVKLLVLYSGMLEDERLVRAASGALAMIAHDRVVSNKITTCTTQWVEVMQGLAANDVTDIQYRGVFILASMMSADQEVAYRIVNSDLMELLMAVSKLEEPERKASAKLAEQALKQAEEWNLIRSIATM